MNIGDLPTPALLVDIDTFESNLTQMAGHVKAAGKSLRPHAKAHKCPDIARRQIAAGAVGVCVATVAEAEIMVAAGIEDVLLTSPIADPAKCARLAARAPAVSVVVDHPQQVSWYAEAAANAGVSLNILVDLDLGDHRTGIAPGLPAVRLAEQVAASRSLRFQGLQAYSVRASHLSENDGRAAYTSHVLEAAVETRALLQEQGMQPHWITGGSTGSYSADSRHAALTELQAGSYALMDLAYRRIGGVDFGNALTVLATVVSANHADRVTVDAGFKAFSTDRPFGPEPLAESRYEYAGDEFGFVFLNGSCPRPQPGDRLRFLPPHCDPTVNLYDRIYVCQGDVVVETWPVMRCPAPQVTHA